MDSAAAMLGTQRRENGGGRGCEYGQREREREGERLPAEQRWVALELAHGLLNQRLGGPTSDRDSDRNQSR